MDTLKERLDVILEEAFPGSDRQYDSYSPGRIGGLLTWDKFDGVNHRERQRLIWNTLRTNLPVAEQQRITAILAFSPYERDFYGSHVEDDIEEKVAA